MHALVGKWQQPEGQRYPGLSFEFYPDGTYQAVLEELGIVSSGTYHAANGLIDLNQTQHTTGLLGQFEGRYRLHGETLSMTFSEPGRLRPASLEQKQKRLYRKVA